MRTVIFIDAAGDLLVFPSKEAAIAYLEPIDVAAGQMPAWDREGRRLVLRLERNFPAESFVSRVLGATPRERILMEETGRIDPEGLQTVLRDYLCHPILPDSIRQSRDWLERQSLETLVDLSSSLLIQNANKG